MLLTQLGEFQKKMVLVILLVVLRMKFWILREAIVNSVIEIVIQMLEKEVLQDHR